jgi:hypothetical protein
LLVLAGGEVMVAGRRAGETDHESEFELHDIHAVGAKSGRKIHPEFAILIDERYGGTGAKE